MKRFISIIKHNSEQACPILVEVNRLGNITDAVWGHYTSEDYVKEGEVKTAKELNDMSDRYGGSPWCQDAPEWVGRTFSDLKRFASCRARELEIVYGIWYNPESEQHEVDTFERWMIATMGGKEFASYSEAQQAIDNGCL